MSTRSIKPFSVLFVCGGNTCRSPIAAGLAKQLFGSSVRAQSAGIDAGTDTVTPEALKVMEQQGIDISGHRPQDISSIPVANYDLIVAMTPSIGSCLKRSFSSKRAKLIVWKVSDPYGKGLEEYQKCAGFLRTKVLGLAGDLGVEQRKNNPAKVTKSSSLVAKNDLSKEIEELRAYIDSGISRLKEGKLFGSHLIGVGSKSADLLDSVLRRLLGFYLAAASVDYEEKVKKIVNSKPLDQLTMGQVILVLRTFNSDFTYTCRSQYSRNTNSLANRRLFTKTLEQMLSQITKMRNEMHHDHANFAKDEERLRANTIKLFTQLRDVIDDPLFVIPTLKP